MYAKDYVYERKSFSEAIREEKEVTEPNDCI